MTKDQIKAEALALDPAEREALADDLLLSLDGERAAIDAAWVRECRRRIEAVDRGEMATIPGDRVMAGLLERLKQ